ncbi:MAG: ABC transporter ATP-binding protein [Pseudomonadota bacterium]
MIKAPTLFLNGSAGFDGVSVFDGLSIEVEAGKWTCLLGSSGVGKSTVLKILAGIGDTVTFAGEFGSSAGELEGQVALMAQSDLLMPWLSVSDNIKLGSRLRGELPDNARVDQVLARVGLTEKTNSKPHELSGGQRQRVALARTLMEDRPVVLLDEPFSALDARTRAQMQELTAEVLQGRTVLLVTHDPAEAARLGDAIKVMTVSGIEDFSPPSGSIPRPVESGEVLQIQAKLLARLREED